MNMFGTARDASREKLRAMLRDMVAGRTPVVPVEPMAPAVLNLGAVNGMVGWQDEPVGGPAVFPLHLEARPSAAGAPPSPGVLPQGPNAGMDPYDPAFVQTPMGFGGYDGLAPAVPQAGPAGAPPSPGPIGYGAMPVDPAVPPLGPRVGLAPEFVGARVPKDAPSPGVLPQGPNAGMDPYDPAFVQTPMGFGGYDGLAPAVPQAGPDAVLPLDPAKMRDALRGTYDDTRRFDDARAVDVAQAGGGMPDTLLSFGTYGADGTTPRNRIEADLANARNALSRLSNIDAMLAENGDLIDSLTWSGDMRRRVLALRDKTGFDMLALDNEQKEYLSDATEFRQNILRNINRTIKEVTGAQMGEAEARRIRAEMPDVDASPEEFLTKLAAAMDMIRMDAVRYQLWLQNGSQGEVGALSDNDVRSALRSRGEQLYREALRAGMSPGEAKLAASRGLSEEFGL